MSRATDVPAVELIGVAKRFRAGIRGCSAAVTALEDVSLSVNAGEVLALVGPAGAGKTTLLLCAAGLLKPDQGRVRWFGDATTRPPGVAFCTGRAAPFAFLTVRETLEYHLMVHDLDGTDRELRVAGALTRVGLREQATVRTQHLSAGAQRRLALAQALLLEPRLLLLDGIFGGLEDTSARMLRGLVATLASEGVAVVAGERDADVLDGAATRALLMSAGSIRLNVNPALLARKRFLELEMAAMDDDSLPVHRSPAIAQLGGTLRGRHLRVPLNGVTPEGILAQCRALQLEVRSSRLVWE